MCDLHIQRCLGGSELLQGLVVSVGSGIKETLANHRNGHTAYFSERNNVPQVHPTLLKGAGLPSIFLTDERNKPDTERKTDTIRFHLNVELLEPEGRMAVARGGREGH